MQFKKIIIQTVVFLFIIIGTSNANTIENVVGIGLGLPYGGAGINYELSFHDYFAPTMGLGYLSENLGWNAGVRLYYPERASKFRGRLTALYGTNTVLKTKYYYTNNNDYKTETGFSGGIGFNWRFGKAWAFDGDFYFVNSDIPAEYEEEDNKIVSLGFSYRW